MFFTFPEDAHWNAERQVVEYGSRSASTRAWSGSRGACSGCCYPERPTPERCVEAYYLQRTRFESIAERKLPGVS
jgi:hypothetical protein